MIGNTYIDDLEMTILNSHNYEDFSNIDFDEFGIEIPTTKYAKHFNTAMDFYDAGVDAFTYMQNAL